MTTYTPIAESNNFIVLEKYSKEWKVAEGYQSEDSLERELIQDALKTTRGNRARAARFLQTTERIIGYKVRALGINDQRFRD